jgi:hypothetical protein
MKFAQPAKKHGVEISRRRLHAVNPREDLLIRDVEPTLEFAKVSITQRRKVRISKATENQVHLADTAMPASE